MIKALIPGSFDPITIGHIDLITRASHICDKIYVGIMVNPAKNYLFSVEERIELAKKATSHLDNVEVVSSDGLTVDLCRELGCSILLKGVRTNNDYEYELNQANINMLLEKDIETILMLSKPEYSSITSSMVKEVWSYRGNIRSFIPDIIYDEVINKLKERY